MEWEVLNRIYGYEDPHWIGVHCLLDSSYLFLCISSDASFHLLVIFIGHSKLDELQCYSFLDSLFVVLLGRLDASPPSSTAPGLT